MRIEWKYSPKWATEVRRKPNSSTLVWCGGGFAECIATCMPIYHPSRVVSWPIVCKRGEDVELHCGLLHVYTIAGHKIYAESMEVSGVIKQLLVDRVNSMSDHHFEMGE